MNDSTYINQLIHRAVMIATQKAMCGRPLAGLVWIPPQSATSDPFGSFVTKEHTLSPSVRPPWI